MFLILIPSIIVLAGLMDRIHSARLYHSSDMVRSDCFLTRNSNALIRYGQKNSEIENLSKREYSVPNFYVACRLRDWIWKSFISHQLP